MKRLFGVMFAMLVAFFAGVIATLVVLAPGERSVGDILRDRGVSQNVDFNLASDRIEALGDQVLQYAYCAKERFAALTGHQ